MSDTTVGATPLTELPRDTAAAATMRAQLVNTPEYMEDWKTNQTKQAELGYLRWVAGGNDPDRWAKPPESVGDVLAQHGDRGVQAAEAHAQALDKHFDLTPRQQFEALMRRPVYQHEKDKAANDFEKNIRDATYMERWNKGDRQARTEMYLLNAIKAAPLSRSEEETLAWDAAHPFVGWNHA